MRRWVSLILLLALLLRLGYSLPQDPLSPYSMEHGGDELWYMANGAGLASGQHYGLAHNYPFDVASMNGASFYLLFIGLAQRAFPPDQAVHFIRLVQVLLDTATVYFAYALAASITKQPRAGYLAALVVAISPAFIITASIVFTETVYIFLLTAAVWVYGVHIAPDLPQPKARRIAVVGALLGLATLTRAVAVLFPLMLVLHLLWYGRAQWRRSAVLALLLLMVYGGVVGIWTVFKWGNYGRFEIASTQLLPSVWRGAMTNDTTPEQMDAQLMADCTPNCDNGVPQTVYQQQIITTIMQNVGGFIQLRLTELLSANLQPHTIEYFGQESLRDLALHWLQEDFSGAGFVRLLNGDSFWVKLGLYILHYSGLVLGIMGVWRWRKQWRWVWIPLCVIVYTNGIHLLLLALPRYIFPTQVYWWILAGMAITQPMERDNDAQRITYQSGTGTSV